MQFLCDEQDESNDSKTTVQRKDNFNWQLMPFDLKMYTMSFLNISDLMNLKSINRCTYLMISHNYQKLKKLNVTDLIISAKKKCNINITINSKNLNIKNFDDFVEICKHINITGVIYTQNVDLNFLKYIPYNNISSANGAVIWDTKHLNISLLVNFLNSFNCQYLQICNTNIIGYGDKIFESLSNYVKEIVITEDTYCELSDKSLYYISKKSSRNNTIGNVIIQCDGAIFTPNGIVDFIKKTNFIPTIGNLSLRCVSGTKEEFLKILCDNLNEEIQDYSVYGFNVHAFQLINRPLCIFVKEFLYN
uniref:F-box domain-containing protein n=1 Tax=Strongyloides stercoralis TaxID=6248 RepID=A0A0K0EG53_STRER